jgi:hypothetical protein
MYKHIIYDIYDLCDIYMTYDNITEG